MSRQFPALRGIAILLVVLNHAITLSLETGRMYGFTLPTGIEHDLWLAIRTLGLIAVPTFYFLSGGFLVYAVRGKSFTQAYRTVLLALRHILVPYLVWSIGFYVLIFFIQHETYSLPGYLKNLAVGYPLNFVPLLMVYYLIAPLLVKWIARMPWFALGTIALYQAFSVIVLRPGLVGVTLPAWMMNLTIPGIRLSVAIWGVFFPLGLAYGLFTDRIQVSLRRWLWLVIGLGGITYGTAVLHELGRVNLALAELIFPVFVILVFPFVDRGRIPFVLQLEQLGRRAYGLYLSNLIWLSLALIIVRQSVPWLMSVWIVLIPILSALTIGTVTVLMGLTERMSSPLWRRYLFG